MHKTRLLMICPAGNSISVAEASELSETITASVTVLWRVAWMQVGAALGLRFEIPTRLILLSR
jgi:hypothetical protein